MIQRPKIPWIRLGICQVNYRIYQQDCNNMDNWHMECSLQTDFDMILAAFWISIQLELHVQMVRQNEIQRNIRNSYRNTWLIQVVKTIRRYTIAFASFVVPYSKTTISLRALGAGSYVANALFIPCIWTCMSNGAYDNDQWKQFHCNINWLDPQDTWFSC